MRIPSEGGGRRAKAITYDLAWKLALPSSCVFWLLRADLFLRVGKALATARMAKKNADGKSMTQKELATAVNAKPQDVSTIASRDGRW